MGKICYNTNCSACSTWDRLNGKCIYSDGCSEFKENGFGSAKKKTNFDHIKEMSVDEFINLVSKQACPPGSGNCETYKDLPYKTCQGCWKQWLEAEYEN